MNRDQVTELLLQSLEHERGGVHVYETALKCVNNHELKKEFEKYLNQTRNHGRILLDICAKLKIDPEQDSAGRSIVRSMGLALVHAICAQSRRARGRPNRRLRMRRSGGNQGSS